MDDKRGWYAAWAANKTAGSAELGWRDTIDRDGERAKREIKSMAQTARRSLGQRIRYDRAEVRRLCA